MAQPTEQTLKSSEEKIQVANITRDALIAAPIEIVFDALLEELGPEGQMPDGKPFPFVIEPWPGGRWYRDLGNKTGHFWGHVQVIKPPKLLEINGPMFMSYPAINFLQYRLAAEGTGTRMSVIHKAMGLIPSDHLAGMEWGWDFRMNRVSKIAERLAAARGQK